jgi:hypothetical protein
MPSTVGPAAAPTTAQRVRQRRPPCRQILPTKKRLYPMPPSGEGRVDSPAGRSPRQRRRARSGGRSVMNVLAVHEDAGGRRSAYGHRQGFPEKNQGEDRRLGGPLVPDRTGGMVRADQTASDVWGTDPGSVRGRIFWPFGATVNTNPAARRRPRWTCARRPAVAGPRTGVEKPRHRHLGSGPRVSVWGKAEHKGDQPDYCSDLPSSMPTVAGAQNRPPAGHSVAGTCRRIIVVISIVRRLLMPFCNNALLWLADHGRRSRR